MQITVAAKIFLKKVKKPTGLITILFSCYFSMEPFAYKYTS